ncbi:MAG: ankyrin repeat domain-containing protein [Elusimicrobia bacterium]|nr:ankyrin repeat domain-containing protein [Elusimicrobiota bacterium]
MRTVALLLSGAALAALLGACAVPLVVAARDGQANRTRELLGSGSAVDKTGTCGAGFLVAAHGKCFGGTPLMMAALTGHAEVAKLLIEKGADVNTAVGIGATPLQLAAFNGYDKVIGLLLQHGADIEAAYPYSVALDLYAETFGLKGAHPLGGVSIDFVRTSIDADVESATPLILAAYRGYTDAARVLLARGANPAAKNAMGLTAEALANKRGHRDTADVLAPAARPAAAGPAVSSVQKAPAYVSDIDAPRPSGQQRPDDFALVIGIEDYQALPKAEFGTRDARAARKQFEALGLPARNVIVLEGASATGSRLRSYLEEWLPRNVKDNSTLWVYYSGHGAPDPQTGEAYLVPWDGDPQFLQSTALPLKKLYADLAKTKAKRVVVALDACFSGAGGRSVLAKGARPLVTKVEQGISPGAKLTVLAAASGDQITGTLEEQGHGMFTYFFFKGLAGGFNTGKFLFDYLNPKVQDEARRQNREQTPVLLGDTGPL